MVSDEKISELKKQVVFGAKQIFRKRLVERGEGNVSVRIPGRDQLLITPTLNDYEHMTREDVVCVDFDGNKLDGRKEPSSEYRLHIELYKMRPRAGAIIHTHSRYVSMMSVVGKYVPVLFEEMVIFLGGQVPVAPFGRANTNEIAATALKSIGKSNAVIMGNHGLLACGRTMEFAIKSAELSEKMASIYYGALQLGDVNITTLVDYHGE